MNFDWTEEQKERYAQAVAFAQEHLEFGTEFERERWRRAARFGVLGWCVPEEFGGSG